MTNNKNLFLSLKKKDGGSVIFCNNRKCKAVGVRNTGDDTLKLLDILLVDDLEYNFISISQQYDKGTSILFKPSLCSIINHDTGSTIFRENKHANVYIMNFNDLNPNGKNCLVEGGDDTNLWRRKIGRASMGLLQNLSKKELVRGKPLTTYEIDKVCEACIKGKFVSSSYKNKDHVSTTGPLHILPSDLFGPVIV